MISGQIEKGISAKAFLPYVLMLVGGLAIAYLTSRSGMLFPSLVVGLIAGSIVLVKLFASPKFGFTLLLLAGFFAVGLSRYTTFPLGLMVDFILVLTFLAFFTKNIQHIDWSPLKEPLFIILSLWFALSVLEIANPESKSIEAWFFAMRGVALYILLTIGLGLLLLSKERDLDSFLKLWFLLSVLGTIWGWKQLNVGLDDAEKAWLSVPGNSSTHILFGKLRVFSFYSDAGQFGAAQAHATVVAAILAIKSATYRHKVLFGIIAAISLYGMLISGTRGAIVIPAIGGMTYLLLARNFKVVILGALVFATIYGGLKYTSIGHNIYEIRRIRTALDPNNPSLKVRLENQKKLSKYLESRPFGGGIGSAGYWGQRFSPNSFLANLALDSWYVRIAAEYGFVGLTFYLFMIVYIIRCGYVGIRDESDPSRKGKLIALYCGLTGILVASYGNQVFGQMPTAVIIYLSIVFLYKRTKNIAHA